MNIFVITITSIVTFFFFYFLFFIHFLKLLQFLSIFVITDDTVAVTTMLKSALQSFISSTLPSSSSSYSSSSSHSSMWLSKTISLFRQLLQPFRQKNSVEPLFCQKPKVANPDESPRPEKQAATRASPEVELSDSGSSTVSSNRSPLQSNNVEADTDPNGCMAVKTTNHKFAYKGAEVCGSSSDVGRPVHSAGNRPLTSDVRNLPKKCVKSTSQSRNTREVQTVETDLSAAQTKTCESKASEA